jgi:FkbM family methyltransferase
MQRSIREYQIGRTKIVLPADHALDRYQTVYKKYDRALGEIARLISGKYPGFCAIDIGANVGDSAALISTHQEVAILCIEGGLPFVPFLLENARRLGPQVEIEIAFIGDDASTDRLVLDVDPAGTAKLVPGALTGGVEIKSLASILAKSPRFASPKLLKIDTDGFDFQIITSSVDLIGKLRPVVFYEYAPFLREHGIVEGLQSIRSLVDAGYAHFIVYDNFGNYLIHLDTEDMAQFVDLNVFLASSRANETTVGYFDVCAFVPEDRDLFEALRRYELDPYITRPTPVD